VSCVNDLSEAAREEALHLPERGRGPGPILGGLEGGLKGGL